MDHSQFLSLCQFFLKVMSYRGYLDNRDNHKWVNCWSVSGALKVCDLVIYKKNETRFVNSGESSPVIALCMPFI